MGRHAKPSDSKLRRNSVIAMTGLVPVGLVAAAATTAGASPRSLMGAAHHETEPTASTTDSADLANAIPEAVAAVQTIMLEPEPAPVRTFKAAPEPEPEPEVLHEGPLGIPGINYAAYRNAERILAEENPACGMHWTLLAGIGRVESGHANGGRADDKGNLFDPVIGLPLDGSLPGQAVIHDTDGGVLDGDTVYDRAVGPMQFIPTTWNQYAGDGNGDGVADPQNLYDSTLTTAKYLCDGGLDMRNIAHSTKAIHRYNNSMAYVANVLAWSTAYSTGIDPSPADLPRIH
ncbi:lytic transglycosylase domain-containing protein [Rhodococcus sp. Rp3]|uniref:lytic transglycosylase domain-containing protein n=1 Tax=Rhodococcus sp. Rp3 TaxID=2807635 RepID=UPI00233F5345|nr:lytic murein transglycosylase [Rhodococcus sp. Rp3]MDC3727156.1 lytic murein transglycosylase [Rhodococcus sp. Rp3]